jgi:hypothetical protein
VRETMIGEEDGSESREKIKGLLLIPDDNEVYACIEDEIIEVKDKL